MQVLCEKNPNMKILEIIRETQGPFREGLSESSVNQTDEPTNRNIIGGCALWTTQHKMKKSIGLTAKRRWYGCVRKVHVLMWGDLVIWFTLKGENFQLATARAMARGQQRS